MRSAPAEVARSTDADRLVEGLGRPLVALVRRVRSLPRAGIGETVACQRLAGIRAVAAVRWFYLAGLGLVVLESRSWPALRRVDGIEPLWPARWIDRGDPGAGIDAVLVAFTVAAVAVAFWPASRLLRGAYAVALLEYLAVRMGFGKINHDLHAWLFASLVFVALPSAPTWARPTGPSRRSFLAVVFAAQALVLFSYSLTGLWKVAHAVRALFTPATSGFEVDAFSRIVAERLLQTDQQVLLGDLVIDRPVLGWALYLGTMYLELFALVALVRPRLHRAWGCGLLAFHLGTELVMGFTFVPAIFLLGVLVVGSPFAPERVPAREVFGDLPGPFGLRRVLARRAG